MNDWLDGRRSRDMERVARVPAAAKLGRMTACPRCGRGFPEGTVHACISGDDWWERYKKARREYRDAIEAHVDLRMNRTDGENLEETAKEKLDAVVRERLRGGA